jgi:C4-dicarboxylate transporter DctQ subunit
MLTLDRVLTRIEDGLAALALAVATALAVGSVLLRYLFGVFIFWTDEAIIYSIIFSTFLGAVVALRHNEHVRIDVLVRITGKRAGLLVQLIGGIVTLIYLGTIGLLAWIMIFEPFSLNAVTPALKAPLWLVSLAVPVGLTLMFLRAVEMIYRTARRRPRDEWHKDLLLNGPVVPQGAPEARND